MAKINTDRKPPLKLDGLTDWLVDRGLEGLSVNRQLAGFCARIHEAGFPLRRANMSMATLHPRYGAETYVWRPGLEEAERTQRERQVSHGEPFKNSPISYMNEKGEFTLRRSLTGNQPLEFPILEELRLEGMCDYAAVITPFGSGIEADTYAGGIFFSSATDDPAGFDPAHLQELSTVLPTLALALKSRATYDVAHTVLETYLGGDAGHRVLTGAIERGSVETIRAVLWFCDLRGFTRVSDTLPRGELVELLDDYLELMARPVHDNHGQILKFLGDGFLATFDLTALDGEAVCKSALKAASELRSAFPPFNAERKKAGKVAMEFGLSLHLGDVLYGNIGAAERLDFTVIGPAVNEASRIQALCRTLGRDILISSAFHEAATICRDGLSSLGFHALRGVRQPEELFALVD
ncbi:MAG: adenylate/guanylate cyclase domain-containing protein [Alphaproteobacteria bacterium]